MLESTAFLLSLLFSLILLHTWFKWWRKKAVLNKSHGLSMVASTLKCVYMCVYYTFRARLMLFSSLYYSIRFLSMFDVQCFLAFPLFTRHSFRHQSVWFCHVHAGSWLMAKSSTFRIRKEIFKNLFFSSHTLHTSKAYFIEATTTFCIWSKKRK